MKVFALVILSCGIPSVCSAHSGAVLNAAANYLPMIAPFAAGILTCVVKFLRNPFASGSMTELVNSICKMFKKNK